MSSSTVNLLDKIERLKKWQEEQQQHLLEHHNKHLRAVETPSAYNKNHTQTATPKIATVKFVNTESPSKVLHSNDNILNPRCIVKTANKRPFLRRGAGLARFKMSSGDQFKTFCKVHNTQSVLDVERPEPPTEVTPLKKPEGTVCAKATWSVLLNNENQNRMLNDLPEPPGKMDANASGRELQVFEALEKLTTQNSFCSTNSSVLKLFSSSTPCGELSGKPEKHYLQFDRESIYPDKIQNGMVREELDFIRHSDLSIPQFQPGVTQDMMDEYQTLIEGALKFKQLAAKNDAVSVNSDDIVIDQAKVIKYNDETCWSDRESDSSLYADDVPSNKYVTVGTMTELVERKEVDTLNVTIVENKLTELKKIEDTLRTKSSKLDKLKEQLERQRKEFEKEKQRYLKELEDKKIKNNNTLDEERKKLAKEKMVFERYVKDQQSKPSRKEREEILALKAELSAVKETLKLKETKNGTTHARLRNQVKCLEKDNANLKQEIENLNRKYGQLVASQRLSSRNPSNTKLLHQINKVVTKVTEKQMQESCTLNEKLSETTKNVISNENKNKNTGNFEKPTENLQEYGCNNNNNNTERTVRLLENGAKEIRYSNRNIKIISEDGNLIVFKYSNGDIKETNHFEGITRYLYFERKINQTTCADGTDIFEFPNGQTEKRFQDNSYEIRYTDGVKRTIFNDGTEQHLYPDGKNIFINSQGEKIVKLSNGQKEFVTKDHTRREYPDGTVKILYPDGSQETRYSSGRIRLKDGEGKLLSDTTALEDR